jgi:hypothetical protein
VKTPLDDFIDPQLQTYLDEMAIKIAAKLRRGNFRFSACGVAGTDSWQVSVSAVSVEMQRLLESMRPEKAKPKGLSDAEDAVYSILSFTPIPQPEIAKRSGYADGEYLTKILGDLFKAEMVYKHARGWLKAAA